MSEVVHCPKCQSAVTVGADQAGTRVQCPSCLKQFLAPSSIGQAGATSDDEDWLSLGDPVELAAGDITAQATGSDPKAGATSDEGTTDELSPFIDLESPDSEDILADDPFVETPSSESGAEDLFADLPPVEQSIGSQTGAAAPSQKPQKAEAIDPEQEFRVKCQVCGSVLYAKAKQTGSKIRCSDCFTEIRVPKPPKKKTEIASNENAATFSLADTGADQRRADPFKKSAQELLREAETEPDEEEFKPAYDVPSVTGWFKSVFGIFVDPGVIIHFVGLSVFLALPAAVTYAYPVLAIGMVPLVLIGVTLSVACGFAILFGVSNEVERIEDWPTVDPTSWFDSLWLVVAATAIAVGPAYVIATLFNAPNVLKIGLVMFSVYAAFPIFLLSMLDMQSVTSPFSTDVAKSITRCQEDWGAFYFSSGALFAALFGFFLLSNYSPTAVGIGVVLSIATVFLYFAMLGRLALAIGNVVDLSALESTNESDEA